MTKKKFLRRNWKKYKRLKKNWRRPRGRHNKMRERKKGYPKVVKIGRRTEKANRGKIDGKGIVIIRNIQDLKKDLEDKIVAFGKLGKKKKEEIKKMANEMKIKIFELK